MAKLSQISTWSIYACLFIPTICLSADENTLQSVLANHIDAIGGVDSLVGLRNLKLRLKISEPEFEVEGLYRASSDGQMRIDIFAGEDRVFSEGIDANGGWQQNGAGSQILEISAQGLLALQRGVQRNLRGLMALTNEDDDARLLGRQTLEGIDYFVVGTSDPGGTARQLFIHPQTWLVERSRESKALHPDVSAVKIDIQERHMLFKPLCGVLRSYKSESFNLQTQEQIQSTEILEGRCNLDNDELDLARPSPN